MTIHPSHPADLSRRLRRGLMILFSRAGACLVFASRLLAQSASPTPLQAGEPAGERTLHPGESHAYTVSLNTGDLVSGTLERSNSAITAALYGPDGNEIRRFSPGGGTAKLRFATEHRGVFRLEVRSSDKTADRTYKVLLEKIVALDERVKPAPRRTPESARLVQLRHDLQTGRRQALAAFWAEVRKSGTPLVEPIADDPRYALCTFLWQGDSHTRNVLVYPYPGSLAQDPRMDFAMTHLADTDLWFLSLRVRAKDRFYYQLAVNAPGFARSFPDAETDTEHRDYFDASLQADPLNPRRSLPDAAGYESKYDVSSIAVLPDAPAQPWADERADVPRGKVEKHSVESAVLKNSRNVWVYTPPQYSEAAAPYGLVVLFDGQRHLTFVPTPATLDNLLAEGRIPPLVAVLVAANRNRSWELPCNPTFAEFLNAELIPWVRRSYRVTTDPRRTIIGGYSYGGLAGTYAALLYPETFGNVLSQSGAYRWTPPPDPKKPDVFDPLAEANHVAALLLARPKLPVRFYMNAGADETDAVGRQNSILNSNRHLRDVLLAKDYEVHYEEFIGGHEEINWRGLLANGLLALAGEAASKPDATATRLK